MSKIGVLLWRKIFESGDAKRLAKQVQDISDLYIEKDISYMNDGKREHLLDVYSLQEGCTENIVINIHGGGLFASYKEVNVNFNYEWARMGYKVISLSYPRIPETTLYHQISDLMEAMRYISKTYTNHEVYLTGDSAGAMLATFIYAIHNSKHLQECFHMKPSNLIFKKLGLISIFLHSQRKDLMRSINDVITNDEDKGKPYEKYLLDPTLLFNEISSFPAFLVSSEEDLIKKDSMDLDNTLNTKRFKHRYLFFPKGKKNKLVHVFSVCYPMYEESKEVFKQMNEFFKEDQR